MNTGSIGSRIGVDHLMRVKDRLRNTAVHHANALKLINLYDGPNTFFYLDPPYPGRVHTGSGTPVFTDENLVELCNRMKHIRGRFMLSLAKENARLLPRGWHIKRVKVIRTLVPSSGFSDRPPSEYEIIASNFEIDAPQERHETAVFVRGSRIRASRRRRVAVTRLSQGRL